MVSNVLHVMLRPRVRRALIRPRDRLCLRQGASSADRRSNQTPLQIRWRLLPRNPLSDRMGQVLSDLIPFSLLSQPNSERRSETHAPQIVDKVQDEIENNAEGEFGERVSDSDDIAEDVNFLRLVPADVKQSFQQMVEQAKTRLGLVPKKQKDGSFRQKRKMTIRHIRSMGLRSMYHFHIASDLIHRADGNKDKSRHTGRSLYRNALTKMASISPLCFELAHDVAFNKSHCWEKLKCYNKALDQAIKCILIDDHSAAGYFKTGRLLQRKKRFFEAEYCFRQALHHVAAGDMLTVSRIRKALQHNVYFAVRESGYEDSVAVMTCHLFRHLSHAASELSSGEAFRQKHMWSSCSVSEPAFEEEDEDRLTEYDKRLKEMVGNC